MAERSWRASGAGYLAAVAATAGMVLLRWLLDPVVGDYLPLATLYGAVAFAVWFGGYRPALLAAVLGYVTCDYLFIQPRGTVLLLDTRNVVGLVLYVFSCVIITGFGEMMRVSQRRFDELVRQQDQLSPPSPAGIQAIRWRHSLHDLTVIGFGLTLAVLLVGGVLGYANLRRLAENEQKVAHTHEVIEEMESLLSTLKDAETGQRGYLLINDDKYLQPYEDALKRVDALVARVKDLTADNADRQARLTMLEKKMGDRLDLMKQTVGLMRDGDRPAALKMVQSGKGKAMMDDLREQVAVLRGAEEDLLRQHAAESEASFRTTVLSELLTAFIGVVLLCIVAFLSQRNLTVRQRAAEVVAGQREWLRVTLASIGDAVITTDTAGRITYLNAVAESLTGWTQKEAAGRPLEEVFCIVNEQSRNTVENPVTRALREGVVVGLANHTVLITKDGTERPIDDSAGPIRDGQDRVIGCVLIFRDITERRRAQATLRENELRLRLALEAGRMGTWEWRIPTNEVIWSPSLETIHGLAPGTFPGTFDAYQRDIHPEDRATVLRVISQAVEQGQEHHIEYRIVLPNGDLRWVEGRGKLFRDATGKACRMIGVCVDITDRKRDEEALKTADRRKNEFLATLAHELRNPLAPIRNAMQILLMKSPTDPDVKWGQDVIDRQVQHMARLLDDLLDVSRISHNKLELRKERIKLSAVIQSAIETNRPLIDKGQQELTVTLPPEPLYLDADPVRLAQVFSNLLNNAAKYSEPGGHIRLTCERQGSDVVAAVKDDGIGIAGEMLPCIFDIFSQSQRALERSQEGLGIGLSLVKGLVELHGGRIEVHSDGPGKGTEFIVRLPVVVERVAQEAVPPSKDVGQECVTKYRLLIVDDLKDSADSLAMLLRMMGHEVHTAYDGEAAVVAAEKFKPEVVLLDIGMPKLNGYDACRRIREQPWGKEMYLIAVTGWGQDDDRRRTDEAGFNQHLLKPVTSAYLMKVLADLQATPK